MIPFFLAQVDLPASWPETVKTEMGIIGLLCIGVLVLTFVTLCKKVFGRTPPMEKQIEKIRREIYEVNGRTKKALEKDMAAQADKINGVADDVEEIKLDRERKWQMLQSEIHTLELTVAKFTGRIEAALNRLEETK